MLRLLSAPLRLIRTSIVAGTVSVATVGGLVGSNLWTYHRFGAEVDVGNISFQKISDQSFQATINVNGEDSRKFRIKGDEWQMDARIIKWKTWMALLGRDPVYQLDRVSGRYIELDQARSSERSVYSLHESSSFDLWKWLRTNPSDLWGMDASYGTSVFLPMTDDTTYNISLSHSGLVARKTD